MRDTKIDALLIDALAMASFALALAFAMAHSRLKAVEEEREAREVENVQGLLDKLPKEVWEKILGNLEDNDLFPLALSCKFFRQKQKELVAQTREKGSKRGKPQLALKTNLRRKLRDEEPASAGYLRFCSKEKVSKDVERSNDSEIVRLAAFHGHLPLLWELLKRLRLGDLRKGGLGRAIAGNAGESSFPLSLGVLGSDFLLSLSSSQRAEAKWGPWSG